MIGASTTPARPQRWSIGEHARKRNQYSKSAKTMMTIAQMMRSGAFSGFVLS